VGLGLKEAELQRVKQLLERKEEELTAALLKIKVLYMEGCYHVCDAVCSN
jgi:hypothetical protein